MTIESEIMRSTLREWLDDTYSEATIRLSKNVVGTLLNRIDAQAARIAEQLAVIDQRNGECDRLFNELAALREQKIQPDPVAVPDEVADITEANIYTAGNAYELAAWMRGANWMRERVLRLNRRSNSDELP